MTEDNMTIKKSTYKMILSSLVIVSIAFAFSAGFLLGGVGKASATGQVVAAPTQQAQPTQQQQVQQPTVAASPDDDPVIGDANAKVTIIEFSDFQCPFCGRFYDQTLGQIKKDYIDTGKAKLVFRDFPLSFHPNAQKASETAECAKEQNKFWEMHDTLFTKQGEWSSLDSAAASAKFKEYAKSVGLTTAFDSCLDTGKTAAEVQKDFTDGSGYGVSGTPTFYINGKELVGAQPYSVFKQAIDQALAG
ncbi:MAG: DsbA family protein [Candidatus Aenigmarchaeota archaeon]|nr:DsbA family protein [Candidatus Aenigmarchaeota archaeon]